MKATSFIHYPIHQFGRLEKWAIPSSTPGGDTHALTDFFVGNFILNNFHLKHFFI